MNADKHKTSTAPRTVFLGFLVVLAFGASALQAGSINCTGTVQSIGLFTRGANEGEVYVAVRLDGASSNENWTLCNIDEGKDVAKTGQALIAAADSYAATCAKVWDQVALAYAMGKKVRFYFLDNVFSTCDDVPDWNGPLVPGEDDPGERLGAWDGLWFVQVLPTDV